MTVDVSQRASDPIVNGESFDPNPMTDEPGAESVEVSLVRPFTFTGGRTTTIAGPIPVEAAVCRRPGWRRAAPQLRPVETELYRLAGDRLSTAEMSVRLDLPLGVVRVLIGDLLVAGHVRLGPTATGGDATLLQRLINGIRTL